MKLVLALIVSLLSFLFSSAQTSLPSENMNKEVLVSGFEEPLVLKYSLPSVKVRVERTMDATQVRVVNRYHKPIQLKIMDMVDLGKDGKRVDNRYFLKLYAKESYTYDIDPSIDFISISGKKLEIR